MSASRATQLDALLAEHGLLVLGAFSPRTDELYGLAPGSAPGSNIVLAGNAGSDMWMHFSQSPEFSDGLADPLDRWSRRVGHGVAAEIDAMVLFPFDGPPYTPFLSWAARTGRVSQSLISMSIHHHYGLWHAYRFALVVPELAAHEPPQLPNPCLSCSTQPCLHACPVKAFEDGAFNSDHCMAHLTAAPASDCNSGGCLARSACPVKPEFQYVAPHARFHMRAFRHSRKHLD
jgi:hypothetical protein